MRYLWFVCLREKSYEKIPRKTWKSKNAIRPVACSSRRIACTSWATVLLGAKSERPFVDWGCFASTASHVCGVLSYAPQSPAAQGQPEGGKDDQQEGEGAVTVCPDP